MTDFWVYAALAALAVGLDLAVGDPHSFPHPVRLIGFVLDRLERFFRKNGLPLGIMGWITAFGLSALSWYITQLLISLSLIGVILAVYFGYAGLALGCLLRETSLVRRALEAGDLDAARVRLAGLVSRDVSAMSESDLRRSLAETLSENLNDGFSAPLFYLCLFGPAGLWTYKTISTMDSMWGYKTPEYRELGQGGAVLDDVLAYVPARLTARFMLLAGRTMGLPWKLAARAFPRDSAKMESPNAGWPMATAAWLCGAAMGGPTPYHGAIKIKPVLGPEGAPWTRERLALLDGLCRRTAYMLAGTLVLCGSVVRALFWG